MDTVSTKVPPSMKEEIEEYAERIDESRSTAVRELIRSGLDSREGEQVGAVFIAQIVGWVMFAGAFFDATPVVGYVGAAIVLLTVLEQRFTLSDQFR